MKIAWKSIKKGIMQYLSDNFKRVGSQQLAVGSKKFKSLTEMRGFCVDVSAYANCLDAYFSINQGFSESTNAWKLIINF